MQELDIVRQVLPFLARLLVYQKYQEYHIQDIFLSFLSVLIRIIIKNLEKFILNFTIIFITIIIIVPCIVFDYILNQQFLIFSILQNRFKYNNFLCQICIDIQNSDQ